MTLPKVIPLRRDSLQALYAQIAGELERDIVEGRHAPFARLPSEQELMKRYGVSRVTVRQAVGVLLTKGLIEAKQGKGTFVTGPVVRHGLDNLTGFYDSLVKEGHSPRTRLLEFGPASAEDRAGTVFEGASGGGSVTLKRLYLLRGRPFAVVHGLLTPEAARVTREQAQRYVIYQLLGEILGIQIARADIGIRARVVEKKVGKLLKLAPGRPLLVMERISVAASGNPVEHSFFFIVPETYEFRLSVPGPLQISSGIKKSGTVKTAGPTAATRARSRNLAERRVD